MFKIDNGELFLILLIIVFGICLVKYPDMLIKVIVDLKTIINTIIK